MRSVYRKVKQKFPYVNVCIWNTSILNEFMIHQPFQFFTLVEVESEAARSVFYFLKESERHVFLEPKKEMLSDYLPESGHALIVNSLVSEAPLQTIGNVVTATLEKVLVDLFCAPSLFYTYQGAELTTIFKEAFSKYTVNENRLLRYADRRGKKDKLDHYLKVNKLSAVN